MKQAILFILLISVIVCGLSFAGEIRTTPQYIVLTDPTTNQVEFLTMTHNYGASPSCIIKFHILDNSGSVRSLHTVAIEGQDYLDFVEDYGATMKNRGDVAVWTKIQELYSVQTTP